MFQVIQNVFLPDPEELGNLPQIHGPIHQGLGDLFPQGLRFIIHFPQL
jgi:hypothetical protein